MSGRAAVAAILATPKSQALPSTVRHELFPVRSFRGRRRESVEHLIASGQIQATETPAGPALTASQVHFWALLEVSR